MNQQIRTLARIFTVGVLIALMTVNARAADVPGFDKPISMAAREQPVDNFFAELFGHLGVPVRVDPGIVGSVNGDFQGTAREIYKDVEKAFQLTMYFDSSMVYIYSSDQVSRKIIPMSEKLGKMVLRNAKQMHIGDSLNKAVWSDMGLVVSGTQRYKDQIESYTRAIRSRTAKPDTVPTPRAEVIRVFKLKYAWADDTTIVSGGQELLVRGVATLLRNVVEAGMVGVESTAGTQRSKLPRTEKSLRGQGLQSVGQNVTSTQGEPDRQAPRNHSNQIATRSNGGDDASSNMSQTSIVADPLSNAVIIRDRPDRMQNYQDLINVLDVEPRMVEIEATIIDMDTDRLRSLGIDWRVHSDGSDLLFGSASATNAQLYSNPAAITDGLTGFTQNVLNNKALFLSRIRALEQQKAARIVSKPHVMTLANVEALLDTTSTFFIRVAGREEVDLFNVSVGTTMRVTPHVFENGGRSQIKLKIDIVDGNQALQEVDGIPVIDESTINTQAIINAGQSLLIGGLVREFKSTGVTKVPVLGNIPGIGALFRNTSKNTSRVERMFLITPRLNSQVSAGKRYSVPILSGSEAQIIESGPSRLEPSLAGLASRDNAFPLEQPLPTGNARVGLTSPNQPLPDASSYSDPFFGPDKSDPFFGPDKPNTLERDKLLRQSPNEQVAPLTQPEIQREFQPAAAESLMVKAPWQEVLPVESAHVQNASVVAPALVKRSTIKPVVTQRPATPTTDLDEGWSEIPASQFRKTARKPFVPVQVIQQPESGWVEIK